MKLNKDVNHVIYTPSLIYTIPIFELINVDIPKRCKSCTLIYIIPIFVLKNVDIPKTKFEKKAKIQINTPYVYQNWLNLSFSLNSK